MKRFLFILLPLFLMGCSKHIEKTSLKLVTFTTNQEQIAILSGLIDEYNKTHKTALDVEFKYIPGNEYSLLLDMELKGSNPPDLFWIMENEAKEYIKTGKLYSLNNELEHYNLRDFDEHSLSLWKYDNNVYAVPFSTSPVIMVYNQDLFNKCGLKLPDEHIKEGTWTWETFRTSMKAIKDQTGVYGFMTINNQGFNERIEMNLTPFLRGFGGDFWNDKEVLFDRPESIKGLKLFCDMVTKDKSVVPINDESNFFNGEAACTFTQISQLSRLKDVPWKWSICILPNNSSLVGQASFAVNANSKNREIASKLVAYMTSESSMKKYTKFWPSCRKSVLNSPEFLESNPYLNENLMKDIVVKAILNNEPMALNAQSETARKNTTVYFDKMWLSDSDVPLLAKEIANVYRSKLDWN